MYSNKTVNTLLDKFYRNEGWMPKANTPEDVNEFTSYLASTVNIESDSKSSYITLKKPLSVVKQDEIRRRIVNEQVMCSADYSYWESRYAYVRNEKGEVAKFENRISQRILDFAIAKLDEQGFSKELVVLGSRQCGITTKAMLICTHYAIFHPNSQVLAASPSPAMSHLLGEIMETAYNQCPWWLVPVRMPKNRFGNGSGFSISSSQNTLSQGWTPNCTYIADAGNYSDPMRTLEDGLFRAVNSSPNTIIIVNGTMPPEDTWFRKTWSHSREGYSKGLSRLMPIFIPWFASSDIYPHKDWISKFPIPHEWVPMKETREHAKRCQNYVSDTPMLESFLGKKWKMSSEQKWYWEFLYNSCKATDTLPRFLSMMAADDSEHLDNFEVDESDVDLDKLFPTAEVMQNKLHGAGRKKCQE